MTETPSSPTPTPAGGRPKKTILLVEDEASLLALYRGMLELAGYSVLYTRDGEVAAKICEEHSNEIDLLLSDVLIPGKNGADLSLFIHDRWPQIKILLFSGHPDAHNVLDTLDGVKDRVRFLPKPINQDVLLRTIHSMLR
jgi:DNA-binding NtrC family response regulator